MDIQLDDDAKTMIKDIIRRGDNAKDAYDRVKEQIKDDVKAIAGNNGVSTSKINEIIRTVRSEMRNTGVLDEQREMLDLAEQIVNN